MIDSLTNRNRIICKEVNLMRRVDIDRFKKLGDANGIKVESLTDPLNSRVQLVKIDGFLYDDKDIASNDLKQMIAEMNPAAKA